MTREPKAIPELAKHHARPPHHLGKVKAHFDGDTVVIEVNSDEGKKARDSFERRWGPNLIDDVERKLREFLDANGMPTEAGVVTPTDRGAVRGLDELAKRRGHAIGSDVWYAAKTLEEIAHVRRVMTGGDCNASFDAGLHLGALMREASIDPDTFDLGLTLDAALAKARRAAAELKRNKAALEHQRWKDAARNIWVQDPRLKITECAVRVIGQLGLDEKRARAVRRAIADYRPQK
jgi:hypothetical protein